MMNEQKSKNKVSQIITVLLAILLFIAPCKIRNSINTILGNTPTHSSSKGFGIQEKDNCSKCELPTIQKNKHQSKLDHYNKDLIVPPLTISFVSTKALISNSTELSVNQPQKPPVPLYILFQNLKLDVV